MPLREALQIVLELARQNVIDHIDMPDEHDKQVDAIQQVEMFCSPRVK